MTRPSPKRPYTDHRQVAATAKASPGTWVQAATYASNLTAKTARDQIRSGHPKMRAYMDSHFDAKIETSDTGDRVFVRYRGPRENGGAQ